MRKTSSILAIAGLLTASSLVFGQDQSSGRRATAKSSTGSDLVTRMMKFDKNKDGKLTRSEVTDARLSASSTAPTPTRTRLSRGKSSRRWPPASRQMRAVVLADLAPAAPVDLVLAVLGVLEDLVRPGWARFCPASCRTV